ncbi:ubl carboxyl-terminal hydrolase 18 [Misgurnus anguillicaudatus]|uniref:ubl carboxyl-terminal hydrolase 18 n=1 Tax=Misgurnus anguillicaudatus TaxID=75329 RepID=UPI003CCF688A
MGLSWIKMAFYSFRYQVLSFHPPYVRGLINYRLSCCINALLQSFNVTTELVELLNKWHPSDEVEQTNVPGQLKRALYAIRDPSNPSPHKDFLNCLHDHSISRLDVHDADEIFHTILNLTQKQMADKDMAQEIRKLFEIKVETRVMCKACTYIQKVPNSLFSLPLAIRKGENDLKSCIHSFSQEQTLKDDDECYCDRCSEKQPSTHQLRLVSLPGVLCVHLKRFRIYDGFTRKLENKVTFPDTLQEDIFDAGLLENAEYYSLYAVIVHIGSALCGHYTAYIRPNQDWYYADDSDVRKVSWSDVQCTYQGYKTAYLLLYRKMSRSASE